MIDYNQIQSDLYDVLAAATFTDTIQKFWIEADEREMTLSHMPFINLRMVEAEVELRSLPSGYYIIIKFEVDCIAFDLSSYRTGAQVRDRMVKEAMEAIQADSRFSAGINASVIGPELSFLSGNPEGAQGHIAGATFTVTAEVSAEPA